MILLCFSKEKITKQWTNYYNWA